MKVKNTLRTSIMAISFLFILLPGNPAFGIDWVELSTTSEGNVLSYDKGSVRKIDSDNYRLWERIIYADGNVKENVKTTVFIREINCRDKNHRIISIIDYDANGEKLFNGADDQTEWSAIPLDTPVDDLRKAICPKADKLSTSNLYRSDRRKLS
jgi:hypothetical protein